MPTTRIQSRLWTGAKVALLAALPFVWLFALAPRQTDAQPPAPASPTAPANPGDLHSGMHNLRANTSGTLVAIPSGPGLPEPPRIEGENVLTFPQLAATKMGRKPPPLFLKKVRNLDNKTIRMTGFMVPYDSLTDLRTFMLLSVPVGCFFCVPPPPQEVVLVRVDAKDPLPFIYEPIEIEGTLNLWDESSKDEKHKEFLFIVNKAKVKKASI